MVRAKTNIIKSVVREKIIDNKSVKLLSWKVNAVLKLLFIRGRHRAYSVSKDVVIDELLYEEDDDIDKLDDWVHILMSRMRKLIARLELGINLENNEFDGWAQCFVC